ncbi:ankyrin repeat-containing domain protein [Annulohypoxylon stygium]|nr:ankyrin repeat-containing domain protein [Annulohypoxylon stygium]
MASEKHAKITSLIKGAPSSASLPSRADPDWDPSQFKHLLYAGIPGPRQDAKYEEEQRDLSQLSLQDVHAKDQENDGLKPRGIATIPPEMLQHIASYLPQQSRSRLGQTCRGFSILMRDCIFEDDKHDDFHILWWACAKNEPGVIDDWLTRDPTLVHYRFKQSHESNQVVHRVSRDVTPLVVAMLSGKLESFINLLQWGADVNLRDEYPCPTDSDPNTMRLIGHRRQWMPLNYAVSWLSPGPNFHVVISLLAKFGANLNQAPLMMLWDTVDQESSPGDDMVLFDQLSLRIQSSELGYATLDDLKNIYRRKKDCVVTLLLCGADAKAVDPYTHHTTPYRIASLMVNYQPPKKPKTRTFEKAMIDHVIIPYCEFLLKMMVNAGASLTQPGWDYGHGFRTPLHALCIKADRFEHTIFWMLEHGVDINIRDSYGRTPIYDMVSIAPWDLSVLTRFIRQGANLHHRDNLMRTPLHSACFDGNRNSQEKQRLLIKILLQHGADPTSRDLDDKTPLDLFFQGRPAPRDKDLVNLLRMAETRALSSQASGGSSSASTGCGGSGGRGGRGGGGGRGWRGGRGAHRGGRGGRGGHGGNDGSSATDV